MKSNKSFRKRAPSERSRIKLPADNISNLLIGRNCVREVLLHRPERVLKLICTKNHIHGKAAQDELQILAQKLGIDIQLEDESYLTSIARSDSHQGFAAVLKDRVFASLDQLISRSEASAQSLVLMLDSINDPQNFGALLRAAECFSVDSVIWSKNRGASLTPSVSKASVGATELIDLLPVSNLSDALIKLKKAGYWIVVADSNAHAHSAADFTFPEKTVLVAGAEGQGVQRLIQELADFSVRIILGGKIDSLNVSQALSILLFRYRQNFPLKVT